MATPVLNAGPRPMARPASVDAAFGGTLTTRQVSVAGSQHFVTGSYLLVGPEIIGGNVAGPVVYGTALDLVPSGEFCAGTYDARVIISKKIVTPAEDITAATLVEHVVEINPGLYRELALTATESWWTRRSPGFVSVTLHDRRLEPFFDRLARIERGEWDEVRGKQPSATALENARMVLRHLSGGSIVPKKVLAADGRIVLYFTTGEKYSNIEILNSGVMLLLNSDGQAIPSVKRFTAPKHSCPN